MKVYIVSAGEYSDYCIHGIYDSLEKAKEVYSLLKRYNYSYNYPVNIEEWELNSPIENDYFFHVRYQVDTGEVTYSLYHNFSPASPIIQNGQYFSNNNSFVFCLPYSKRLDNEKVIKKIAYDKWAEYKAQAMEF